MCRGSLITWDIEELLKKFLYNSPKLFIALRN